MIKMLVTLRDGQEIPYEGIGALETAKGRARQIAKEGFWAKKDLFITAFAIKSVKVL